MSDEILTLKGVAALLKVAEKTIYTLAQRGGIPGIKVGRQWRFRRQDLEQWIDTQSQSHSQSSSPNTLKRIEPLEASNDGRANGAGQLSSPSQPDSPQLYLFGPYELDESLYQLRYAGTPVMIEPKVFHLLAYLIRHRHRVASTTELLTQLWPGQVVTPSSLTRCVVKARKALHNTGNQQRIQNHYGHGYRFVAEAGVKTALIDGQSQHQSRTHTSRWRRQPPSNPAAYDYYLRAAESVFRFTPEDQALARQMYEHAIAFDQHYAAAYAGLAWTYWLEWSWFWHQDPCILEQALTLARQAVSLDDSLPFAHLTLGYAYFFKRQYAQAIAEAERSIHLDPRYAWGYSMLADMQTGVGRPQEAIRLIEKAMELEPQSAGYFSASLGLAYRALGKHDEAIVAVRRTLTRNPCVVSARLLLTILYSETNRQKEAKQALTHLRQQLPQLSLDGIRQRFPYQDYSETERIVAALRKAGLR